MKKLFAGLAVIAVAVAILRYVTTPGDHSRRHVRLAYRLGLKPAPVAKEEEQGLLFEPTGASPTTAP